MELWKQFFEQLATSDFLIILIRAIAPCIIVSILIYQLEKHEKEPLALLLKAFMLGILLCLPAAVLYAVAGLVPFDPHAENLFESGIAIFLRGTFSEDVLKYITLTYVFYHDPEFDEPYDGIAYAVVMSMGFLSFDRVSYLITDNGFRELGGLRYLDLIVFPAIAVFMGYFIGLEKEKEMAGQETQYGILGLGIVMISKTLYDLLFFKSNLPLFNFVIFGIVIISVYFARLAIRRHNLRSPFR